MVYRGIIWARQWGEPILETFRQYHPHLLPRIEQGLKGNRYLE